MTTETGRRDGEEGQEWGDRGKGQEQMGWEERQRGQEREVMMTWKTEKTARGDLETQVQPPPLPCPHQPSTGALSSSETPKDMAPMKSLREVRSQSHTSTLSRRSTSPGFRLLQEGWGRVRSSSAFPASPLLSAGGFPLSGGAGVCSCSLKCPVISDPLQEGLPQYGDREYIQRAQSLSLPPTSWAPSHPCPILLSRSLS